MDMLVQCIDTVKNVRSHLDGIILKRRLDFTDDSRLRYGILPIQIGRKRIGFSYEAHNAHNMEYRVGIAYMMNGRKSLSIEKPDNVKIKEYCGIVHVKHGRLRIGGIK